MGFMGGGGGFKRSYENGIFKNKSAAGMHHTPSRNIFDTKTIHKSRAITQVKKMSKIESENKFLTSIKSYNSVLICQNLPICNTQTLLCNIDSHTKFEENPAI